MSDILEIFTVGHSTMSYEQFFQLLRSAHLSAIVDVRSAPYSRHLPHFNRDALRRELQEDKIEYRFLGRKLGGRPLDKGLFSDGVADYEKMAQAEEFRRGLEIVAEGARKHRLALMCSEHDPLDCHRCLLIGRALAERGVAVRHIQSSGSILSQDAVEERLLKLEDQPSGDLFRSRDERLAAAYRKRARKVAYAEPSEEQSTQIAAE
jgi:uncharacterized protein (DUF488 family)